jgi:MSHA biogenesis protein MshO
MSYLSRQAGFSLVEAIVVIAITGILSSVVAVFIQGPVQSYMDASRRAALTDIADTAARRVGRDLRLALPNSVRVMTSGGLVYLEFLATVTGGRYKDDETCFSSGCSSITTFGDVVPAAPIVPGNDRLVIYNQYNNSGADCSPTNPSVYCGNNSSVITAVADGGSEDTISFAAQVFVPQNGSPSKRFQVVSGPVSYVCDPTAGTLRRYSGYAIQPVQPTVFAGAVNALLADSVSNCSVTYDGSTVTLRAGLVSLWLQLTQAGESVNLYHGVHVDNVP